MAVWGIMVEGTQEVQVLHSCARFGGLFSGPDLKGKEIGFLGNRNVWGGQPKAVKLPQQMGEVISAKFKKDDLACASFFGQPENRGVVWKPTIDA